MADWNCNLCKEYQSGLACTYCDDGSEFVRMSNADRIRAMSDEELAEYLINYNMKFGIEYEGWASCLDWLQSEAE